MATYRLRDFKDIVDAVRAELQIDSSDTAELNRIRRDINVCLLNEVVPATRWKWLEGYQTITAPAVWQDATVSVTQNSTSITFATAPQVSLGSFKNKKFATKGASEVYTISAHTAGSTNATLDIAYNSATNSVATFEVWSDWLALPTDCRETLEIVHDFNRDPLQAYGLQQFRKVQNQSRKANGRPIFTFTGDFVDPTPLDGETESDRYRALWIHPAIYSSNTNLHVSYIKEVDALSADADEPPMPESDRVVLLYGALERTWMRHRNEEASAANRQRFQEKLARMLGTIEDSFDKPSLAPDSMYVDSKRGPRGRLRNRRASLGSASGAGGVPVISYLENPTLKGANITDNVTVTALKTIDGRDISVDGATLDAHIASHTVHGIGGSVVGDSDAQTLTSKIIAAGSNHITSTAGKAAQFNASTGDLEPAATTTTELGYVSGVTSALQTQLNGKQATGNYITALTGDVTASGPGSVAGTVAFVGTSSAANVHAAELAANAATDTNTNSTIVKRDASGNFSAGTITATLSGNATNVSGTVAVNHGGTGITSGTSGGVPYYSGSTSIASSAALTANALVVGGGPGAAPAPLASLGTTTTVLHGNASGTPTFGAVALATDVSGQLAIGNGGTGQSTKAAAFDALSPNSAKGDVTVYSTTNARLAVGSDGQVLTADSTQTQGVKWATPAVAPSSPDDLTNFGLSIAFASGAMTVSVTDSAGSIPSAGSPVKVSIPTSETSGLYNQRSITGATQVIVPSGATLGGTSAVAQTLYFYLIDNAGTIELAISGDRKYDDWAKVSTTAIGAGSASNDVLYSTSARTNVMARCVGYMTSTQTTTGTWAQAATKLFAGPVRNPVDSCVYVDTGNGHGSTNTKVRRYTNTRISRGSDISYLDSATNGGTFTINTSGVYSMKMEDQIGAGQAVCGITVNCSALTTNADTLTFAQGRRALATAAANSSVPSACCTLYLTAGDVVRAMDDGSNNDTTAASNFLITRVS